METPGKERGVRYRQWITDQPPFVTDSVRCLRCGEADLKWLPRGGVDLGPLTGWKLCKIGPWYTGRRVSEHNCQHSARGK